MDRLLTIHHNIRRHLADDHGAGLRSRHYGRSKAVLPDRPGNTSRYCLVDDGRSHHRNDPAGVVLT